MILKGLNYEDVLIIPKYSEIENLDKCSIETTLTRKYKLQIPLLSAPINSISDFEMCTTLYDLGGCSYINRFQSIKNQASEVSRFVNTLDSDYWDSIPVIGTIGITDDYFERSIALIEAGCNVLLLDTMHGHHKLVKDIMINLKKLNLEIIVGNIVTEKAAIDLISWGADALKVGIVNNNTIGIPQFTAIQKIAIISDNYGIPVIANDNIRNASNISKALAAGASTVMIGSLLSETNEVTDIIQNKNDFDTVEIYKNKIKQTVSNILLEIKSTMNYVGIDDLQKLSSHTDFIEITNDRFI